MQPPTLIDAAGLAEVYVGRIGARRNEAVEAPIIGSVRGIVKIERYTDRLTPGEAEIFLGAQVEVSKRESLNPEEIPLWRINVVRPALARPKAISCIENAVRLPRP